MIGGDDGRAGGCVTGDDAASCACSGGEAPAATLN
ncbi:hypothetical protein FHU32_001021 [Corynebacterium bovis DSM 20582 = CIP 54.80]|uniref:Uncharacterized protein n=1 Tax=Corynebacterium bovis DSM 20582 = CIP 54.80 TaxID=927655 RepID=A0A8H9Y6B5_9CORY|nr:hypothetical protein [Corynebacterium bovis DSM 20582 = CIP 54.80]